MQPLDFVAPPDRAAVQAAIRERRSRRAARSPSRRDLMDKAGTAAPLPLHGPAAAPGGRDLRHGLRPRHPETQARRGADAARQGAARPRAHRLAASRSGTGTCAPTASTSTRAGPRCWAAAAARDHRRLGRGARRGTTPTTRRLHEAAVANAVQGVSEEFECEYRVRHASGEWIWVHSRGKVTQRGDGGPGAAHDRHLHQRHQAQGRPRSAPSTSPRATRSRGCPTACCCTTASSRAS